MDFLQQIKSSLGDLFGHASGAEAGMQTFPRPTGRMQSRPEQPTVYPCTTPPETRAGGGGPAATDPFGRTPDELRPPETTAEPPVFPWPESEWPHPTTDGRDPFGEAPSRPAPDSVGSDWETDVLSQLDSSTPGWGSRLPLEMYIGPGARRNDDIDLLEPRPPDPTRLESPDYFNFF